MKKLSSLKNETEYKAALIEAPIFLIMSLSSALKKRLDLNLF